jgi:hypothetical protein
MKLFYQSYRAQITWGDSSLVVDIFSVSFLSFSVAVFLFSSPNSLPFCLLSPPFLKKRINFDWI